jgi:dTDP-4-amino-4,6-dideoxygalactose transaminase
MSRVDFVNLKAGKKKLYKKLKKDFKRILLNTSFVGGEYLEEFEKAFAEFNGTKYCVGVGSGTDALWLALLAYGIGPGDEVIVPSNTFIATAFAVTQAGATPVFADANPHTYNIDVYDLEKLVTEKTKAIIPVHLYGQPCEMSILRTFARTNDLIMIEDCAQATGAQFGYRRVGSMGHAGCFSFYPTKNLGGMCQGGAVITDSEKVANTVRSLGNVGRSMTSHTDFDLVGFNSRLDTINAAFLTESLKSLDLCNGRRIEIAEMYNEGLKELPLTTPFVINRAVHVYHLYTISLIDNELRDGLQEHLKNAGIGCGVYYPKPCHKQPMYDDGTTLPVSEGLAETTLSLPMHLNMKKKDVGYVCDEAKKFFDNTDVI